MAEVLGKEASRASDLAWQIEMALRDVRHACSKEEKDKAVDRLNDTLNPYLNWRG